MNIIPYNWAYFWGSLYFVPIWLWLFFRLRKHRQFMVFSGLVYMWLGLAAEYLWWTTDWWKPITITGTRVGIEDLIMCFTHVAIPIFIFKYFFGIDVLKLDANNRNKNLKRFLTLMMILFGAIIIFFYFFHLHSFISTTSGLAITGAYMLLKRKDLVLMAFGSAVSMILITFPVYFIGSIISPGAIEKLWTNKLIGVVILGYPIEDMIWYASVGFFFGITYEFIANLKNEKTDDFGITKDLKLICKLIK